MLFGQNALSFYKWIDTDYFLNLLCVPYLQPDDKILYKSSPTFKLLLRYT